MSATSELRRLLDERGIEWWPDRYYKDTNTCWRIDGFEWRASERDGKLLIGCTCTKHLTPEQAIAATVGRETCHDTGDERIFHCSECGFGLEDVYLSDEGYLLDDDGEWIEPWPPFCPNCGRRVVQP